MTLEHQFNKEDGLPVEVERKLLAQYAELNPKQFEMS